MTDTPSTGTADTTEYTYDAAGWLASSDRSGPTGGDDMTDTYDPMGSLSSRTLPTTPTLLRLLGL
jgi:uncharacterized protein RhaS with RHS repeats